MDGGRGLYLTIPIFFSNSLQLVAHLRQSCSNEPGENELQNVKTIQANMKFMRLFTQN